MCVCCTHVFSFFPLVFVLVNGLLFSGFSLFLVALEMLAILSLLLLLFLFVVCICILFLLPCLTIVKFVIFSFIDVSCTPTGVSEINDLT